MTASISYEEFAATVTSPESQGALAVFESGMFEDESDEASGAEYPEVEDLGGDAPSALIGKVARA